MTEDADGPRPLMRFDRPAEWPRLKALFDHCFGREDEANLVEQLRADNAFSFLIIAEIEDGFIGACGFCPLPIVGERRVEAVALAPLAVVPEYRGAGVGAGLVRAGIAQCRRRGVEAVVVLGAPRFYGKLGFTAEAAAKIDAPWAGVPSFQALALSDGIEPMEGEAQYPAAFFAEGL